MLLYENEMNENNFGSETAVALTSSGSVAIRFFTSGFVNDDIVLALIARNRQQKGHIIK